MESYLVQPGHERYISDQQAFFDSLSVISLKDALDIACKLLTRSAGTATLCYTDSEQIYWKIESSPLIWPRKEAPLKYRRGSRKGNMISVREIVIIDALTGQVSEVTTTADSFIGHF